MKKIFNLIIVVLITVPLNGQSDELSATLKGAANLITTVETQKYRYEQSLAFDEEQPWAVEISVGEFSVKNGKGETMIYQFNLSDLDKRLINYEDDKDELTVALKTTRRQKLIRATDEEGDVEYEGEIILWSNEIDDAKKLVELLRAAVPMAEEGWEQSFNPGTTTQELNEWLTENVVPTEDAEVGWSTSSEFVDQADLTVTPSDEEATTYRFSLADLATNSLELSIRKGAVAVEVGTVARDKLIRVEEAGQLEDYTNGVTVPVGSIDAARRLIQSLESALPLAKKIREARMPNPTDLEEGLRQLGELLTEVERKGEVVKPEITTEPVATLMIRTSDIDKGEEESTRQLFDFGDLAPRKVELRIKGTALDVVAETKGGDDFIQRWEGEEEDGFEDELIFPVPSVEIARRLEVLLPYLMAEAAKLPPETGDYSWLKTAAAEGGNEDLKQNLEANGEDCKWKVSNITEGKKPGEVIYELNLYDLDKNRVRYETDSKGVRIVVPTLKNEKIINVLDNGEPEFTDELVIEFSSLAAAKKAAATIIDLIKECLEE